MHFLLKLSHITMSAENASLVAPTPLEVSSNPSVSLQGTQSNASKRHASSPTESPIPDQANLDALTYDDEIAGVYTPLLRMRKKRCLPALPVVPLPPHVIGGLRDQIEKTKQCNCKRSNCLKLYCDCFQNGLHCNSMCNCAACKNLPGPEFCTKRTQAILVTLDRNPHAFRPRLLTLGEDHHKERGLTGCNCKKSFCLKKYCECFQAMIYCSDNCKCIQCNNVAGYTEREMLMTKRRSKDESVAAAAAAHQQHSRMSGRMSMDRILEGREGDITGESNLTSGVDPFIPASSHSIPIRIANNITYSALAFGDLDQKNYSKEPAKIYGARRNEKIEAAPGLYTEVQEAWQREADRTFKVFGAVRKEIKRRNGEVVVEVPLAAGIKKQAVEILDSVTMEMNAVFHAVEKAKHNALSTFNAAESRTGDEVACTAMQSIADDKETNTLVKLQLAHAGAEEEGLEMLECDEELQETKRPDLSAEEERQIAIFVAQDAAMLSELARIIKSRALKWAEERLKIAGVGNS
jgi:Tesmin/TSO1-like CXC domain, cysteine-rich domain